MAAFWLLDFHRQESMEPLSPAFVHNRASRLLSPYKLFNENAAERLERFQNFLLELQETVSQLNTQRRTGRGRLDHNGRNVIPEYFQQPFLGKIVFGDHLVLRSKQRIALINIF